MNEKRISLGGHSDIRIAILLFHVVVGLKILPAHGENVYAN